EQSVRTDHDIDGPVSDALDDLSLLRRRQESRESYDAHRKIGKAIAKRPRMLLAENRCRNEHRNLPTGLNCLEGGANRDLRLAVPDVADEQPVHRLWPFELTLHVIRRLPLIGRVLEQE